METPRVHAKEQGLPGIQQIIADIDSREVTCNNSTRVVLPKFTFPAKRYKDPNNDKHYIFESFRTEKTQKKVQINPVKPKFEGGDEDDNALKQMIMTSIKSMITNEADKLRSSPSKNSTNITE